MAHRRSIFAFPTMVRRARSLQEDESGSLTIFSLFIFICMLMFGGIAVDLMLYENRRTHIQNSTDRAVLAAANLNQTVDPAVVVQDYLAKVGVPVSPSDIDVVEVGTAPVITGRQVAVNVTGGFDTLLMHLVGVNTLPYNAMSEAEESVNDIEVSLILDVSGSMGSNQKLQNMQTAAKDFLDNILAGADDDRVSVSLIPYSTQVSAGPELLGELVSEHNHNFSHCVNFEPEDFDATNIQRTDILLPGGIVPLSQTAHFDPWRNYRYGQSLRYPVCRNESYFDIAPWSNNVTALKAQIDSFEAGGNTSIDIAVKWGAALLDPSMNTHLNNLIADPGVSIDAAFAPRPHAYSNNDSLKFIVVMTDGINTTQYRLHDAFKEGMSPYYMEGDGDLMIEYQEPGNRDGDSQSNEAWYNITHKIWKNTPQSPNVQLTWLEAWANMTMSWRAYADYHQTYVAQDYYDALYDPREPISASTKDSNLDTICSAAKARGVVVFSIGFEVTDHSANVMRSCASTPQHFYRVEGLDIEYAFASIANQINQLKLTQ